jgi:hypothetical protein
MPQLAEPPSIGWWAQPLPGAQVSVVQGLPSSQFGPPLPAHEPPEHTSFVVQAFPSLQGAVLFACAHPLAGTQESFVHGFASSQFGADPPTHEPPEHASLFVHALPSSQSAVLSSCAQPYARH